MGAKGFVLGRWVVVMIDHHPLSHSRVVVFVVSDSRDDTVEGMKFYDAPGGCLVDVCNK